MSELEKNREQAEAELVYWATGRTKIYPEEDFAKNYADIRNRSDKKRDWKVTSARFRSDPTSR
jgi:hypothetical protein